MGKIGQGETLQHEELAHQLHNWQVYGPVFRTGSEVCPFGFDSGRRRYMAFPKGHGIGYDGTRRRSAGMTTSRDALLWERIKPVLVPDEHDDKIAAELTEEHGSGGDTACRQY